MPEVLPDPLVELPCELEDSRERIDSNPVSPGIVVHACTAPEDICRGGSVFPFLPRYASGHVTAVADGSFRRSAYLGFTKGRTIPCGSCSPIRHTARSTSVAA